MLATPKRGISYPVQGPSRTDAPDIPLHLLNLATAIDTDAIWGTGTLAARPAPTAANAGTIYFATDNSNIYLQTGSGWVSLGALSSPVLTGTPTTPTPAIGDNSLQVANTAFVRLMIPPGVIMPYGAAAAPAGYLLCDGSAISRTGATAALFAIFGTLFGVGDGSTTFNLPDLRGRIPVGKNAATFVTLGGVGGEETHALIIAELAAHDHGTNTSAVSAGTPAGTLSSDSAGTPAGTIVAASAGTPAGTLSSDSAGTPAGTIVAASAGTPAGTITAAGGHFHTIHTIDVPGAIADLGWANRSGSSQAELNTDPVADHTHPFVGTAMGTHTHTFTGTAMGAHTHTFTGTAMSNHTHTFTGTAMGTHTHTFTGTALGTHAHVITSQGSGTGHNNIQPYLILNYIVKT